MASSSGLLSMPVEILENILSTKCISCVDLCRIACVCSRLGTICKSNEFWKRKFKQRWPLILDKYKDEGYCWRDEVKLHYEYAPLTRALVDEYTHKFYRYDEISREDFYQFTNLAEKHERAALFIIDELKSIVNDGKCHMNLTCKYYAEKVLRNLQQKSLVLEWGAFLSAPMKCQSLEEGAVLIDQWCQPTICVSRREVSESLDALSKLVKNDLRQKHPEHPIYTTEYHAQHISQSLWSPPQCRQILEAINTCLYDNLGFHGNVRDYYKFSNSYINKVLELRTGIPITMCIVYASIAWRLGVVCEPVNFPGHFLLRWNEHPQLPEMQQYTYIDAFNDGRLLAQNECNMQTGLAEFQRSSAVFSAAEVTSVFERMARNLVAIGRQQGQMGDSLLGLRNALELLLLVAPDDLEMRLLLARVNLHLKINLPEVIDNLQLVADMDQSRVGIVGYLSELAQEQMLQNKNDRDKNKVIHHRRSEHSSVLYPVGMVMRHRRYDYNCIIFGWDSTCQASAEWIQQMGVNSLEKKQHQPFYNVLVQDGTNRYAAQDNLRYPDTLASISHPEVGRYFQEYKGPYYIPNAEKHEEYPEDLAIAEQVAASHFPHRDPDDLL